MTSTLQGPARDLWSMAHLGTPMAIRVAATLGVADTLDGGATADHVAKQVQADTLAMTRLLDYLNARGILRRDERNRYHLTELSEPLRSDHPRSLRPGLDIHGVGRADLAFVNLLHSIQTGEEGYSWLFGTDFWSDLAQDPARRELFTDFMDDDTAARVSDVSPPWGWGEYSSVLDVGGGRGSFVTSLLEAHQDLAGGVLDRPEVAPDAQAHIDHHRLTNRCAVHSGSFFDTLPTGYDAYLLVRVLHDWPDDQAVQILGRCASAAGDRGRVLVVEDMPPGPDRRHSGMDLRMLVLYGGRERSLRELTRLGRRAGLTVQRHHHGQRSALVEFTPVSL